ncbi:glutamate/tyrosine decarboxylase-like PLP-dependent enzyme [Stackebrandtia endophytica]|uniref:Glutamate/tyrosine decarboxylase-like PLP-dependent enzyme n=1 Tax=Stackebrandtia endophytica TaxID=1496996 RepID=A0A543AQ58_9ACTN|nr:glutamate/tyrosine decarboxylase-like PLP-dependent enzyme [Stackebrandtia endophytica]
MRVINALPPRGVPAEQVLAELTRLRSVDLPTHGGTLFSYVYDSGEPDLDALAQSAHALSSHVNGLDPTAFPSLLATENALVAAAAELLGGPEARPVGSVTSGGTESIILAVKAARDSRPEVSHPRMVVPGTAHAAFAKAASYLRVELDSIPVDPRTLMADPSAMAEAVTAETVLIVASAPSYAHGVIDPVSDIAAIAAAAGIRCHVDACFGGWILPYLRRLGVTVPDFDFTVEGVTSVSVDLHKYAYCPKGTSVLLHRDDRLRISQYFGYADWPGYTMVNSGIASTRSGGPIAAAVATMRHIGDDGYLRLAERTRRAVEQIARAVTTVDGLRLMAPADYMVVCFTSDDPDLDLFVLADELAAAGWHTQPQLPFGDIDASIHLTVTAAVEPTAHRFAAALRDAVDAARRRGRPELPSQLTTMVAAMQPDQLTPQLVGGLAAQLGLTDPDSIAGNMAAVNGLLAVASPRVRERLLVEFVSLLQRPTS